MQPGTVLRVVRPTDNLSGITDMYKQGLGFSVLGEFKDHNNFDGVKQYLNSSVSG
jgi:hypothetical protein